MDLSEQFIKQLLACAETAYVIEEDTDTVVLLHNSETIRLPGSIGVPCWKAILGKNEKCSFCPKLTEGVRYSWDYYDSTRMMWYRINNLLFAADGKRYRAGIICTINDAMGLTHDTINELSELSKLLEENRRVKDAFEREANFDRMTGLYNRNRYRLDLASGIYDSGKLGVLYFDLNNLKAVNDTFRHEEGDNLIIRLATAIRQISDLAPASNAYRVGGDEFILFVRNATQPQLSGLKTEFHAALNRQNDGQPIPCSVAVGMAYSAEKCDAELLVGSADKDMYAQKRAMKSEKNYQHIEKEAL